MDTVTIAPFTGFSPAALQFLADLSANNERTWFEDHKEQYQTALLEPAQSFVMALGEKLRTLATNISCDTRTDGRGVLMRMHRDTRFSMDKSPYKTRVSGLFREGGQKKMESPAFGFQIDSSGIELITGIYKFAPPMLNAYRTKVNDMGAGADLSHAIDEVKHAGNYKVEGEHFKRVPNGFDPDHKYASLLRYDGLYVFSPRIEAGDMDSAALVDICYKHYQNMAPIYDWLKDEMMAK